MDTLMSGSQTTFPLSGVWSLPLLPAASWGVGEARANAPLPWKCPKKNLPLARGGEG